MCTLPLLLLSAALGANPPAGTPPAANPPLPNNAVLNFTAKWCGPCQQMSPVVSKLQRAGLPIQKIDLDEQQPLARRFGITSIPAFVLVIDGQVVRKLTGAQSEETLRSLCAQVPAPPATDAPETRSTRPANAPPLAAGRSADAPRPPPGPAGPPRQGRGQSPSPPTTAITRDPFQATVRLRVRDTTGEDVGTGTVLACLDDTAYVLTCGHLFKHWDDATGKVFVELFNSAAGEVIPGRKLAADLDADVAIVSLPIRQPLPSCPLAPRGTRPTKGTNLLSVGCNGGKPPTVERHQVVALNRYRGPDNLECTGIPVRGRSGGGLFNSAGEVVGVCMAEDPNYKDGMYAGLEPIYRLLVANRLSLLLPDVAAEPPADAFAQTFPGDTAPPISLPPDTPEDPAGDSPSAHASRPDADSDPDSPDPDSLDTQPDQPRAPNSSRFVSSPRSPAAASRPATRSRVADPTDPDAELAGSDDPGLPPAATSADDAELQKIVRKALTQATARDLVVVLPGGDSPLGRVLVIHDADAALVDSLSAPGDSPPALLVGVPPADSQPSPRRGTDTRPLRSATLRAETNPTADTAGPASRADRPSTGNSPGSRDPRRISPPTSRSAPSESPRPQAFRRRGETSTTPAPVSAGLGFADDVQ